MKIFIRQGCEGLTGRWLPKVWAVNGPGMVVTKFNKLSDAKEYAVKWGASGKWVRSVTKTGPRQAAQVTYTEA